MQLSTNTVRLWNTIAFHASANDPSVHLTKYVNVGKDQWRFCPALFSSDGRLRQDRVLVKGREEDHPEGSYYIEWRTNGTRHRRSVGKSAPEAHREQERTTLLLKNRALGTDVFGKTESTSIRLTLADACKTFLTDRLYLLLPEACHPGIGTSLSS